MAGSRDETTDEEKFEKASSLFHSQLDWPEGWKVLLDNSNPNVLRAFWELHGCVQCWFEALIASPQQQPEYDNSLPKKIVNHGESTGWLQRRVKDWNDPKSRMQGRYHCKKHSVDLKCAVGIFAIKEIHSEKFGVGHLAWGYETPKPWRDHKHMDKWRLGEHAGQGTHEEGTDGPEVWEDVADEYKVMIAPKANFEEAYLRAMEVLTWPYLLPTHNCQAAVHYVLTGLGAVGLPEECFPFQATYYHWVIGTVHPPYPHQPIPEPAPAPSQPRRRVRARDSAIQTKPANNASKRTANPRTEPSIRRALVVEGRGVAHLLEECPALGGVTSAIRRQPLQNAKSADEVEAQLEMPVCGTCRRMFDARGRQGIFEGQSARITLFGDRVEIAFDGGLFSEASVFDLFWPTIRRVDIKEPMLLSRSWDVVVHYKLDGHWIPSQTAVPFDSFEEAAGCQAAMNSRLPNR